MNGYYSTSNLREKSVKQCKYNVQVSLHPSILCFEITFDGQWMENQLWDPSTKISG